jgi:hypothetical protein
LTILIDEDVQLVAEFMQKNFAATKLTSISEALAALCADLVGAIWPRSRRANYVGRHYFTC